MYSGFPLVMDEVSLPPLSMDQPSSENLDRMLRPSAPRLGESPIASTETWPNSPTLPNAHRDFSTGLGSEPTESQRDKYAEIDDVPRSTRASPVQNFTDLTDFGLDNVLRDVMEGMDYDFPNQRENGTAHNLTNFSSTTQLPMPTSATKPNTVNDTATALNGTHGTFGDQIFGNVNFGDMPITTAPSGSNDQLGESPLMDGGNMDWTTWDDMVTQYGMEGAQANPNSNSASNIGLINWF